VANFLGRSNLVPGTVVETGDDLLGVEVAGSRVHVPAQRAVSRQGQVLVGFRPEKVHLVAGDEEVAPGTNEIGPGTVVDASFSGVSTEYLVDLPGVGTMSVFAQNLDAGVRARRGDRVRLAWLPRHTFGLAGDEDSQAGQEVLDRDGARPVPQKVDA
jgi:spermidine/putrescine transport system ATP-binding protein